MVDVFLGIVSTATVVATLLAVVKFFIWVLRGVMNGHHAAKAIGISLLYIMGMFCTLMFLVRIEL